MTPTERVLAYVTQYFEISEDLYERVANDGDFDAWSDAIDRLEEAHCIAGAAALDRYSVSNPPQHDPSAEEVLEVTEDGDSALVLTQCGSYRYFDYSLVRVDGAWRIEHIQQTASNPTEALVSPDELADHLASASEDAEFQPLSPTEGPSNDVFEVGRIVESEHETGTIKVKEVGTLNLTSGVIAVQDFGYDGSDLMALERKVAPGQYRVEVAQVFGRNAALRLILGDPDTVVAWHPANVPGSGHICGVDAGNLAVFDLESFGNLTVREKESAYEAAVINPANDPMASMLSLVHQNDGVVAASGWGDGAYPVHWGVDADGQPVVLLLDFLIACSWETVHADIELSSQNGGAFVKCDGLPDLRAKHSSREGGRTLHLANSSRQPFVVLGSDGEVVVRSENLRGTQGDREVVYEFTDAMNDSFPLTLRFEVSGYRY